MLNRRSPSMNRRSTTLNGHSTSMNGDFFCLYQQKNLGIKAIPIDWKCFYT